MKEKAIRIVDIPQYINSRVMIGNVVSAGFVPVDRALDTHKELSFLKEVIFLEFCSNDGLTVERKLTKSGVKMSKKMFRKNLCWKIFILRV